MMTMTIESLDESKVCLKWIEGRGWGYQLLIDFLGGPPSLSLIAQWRQYMMMRDEIVLTEGGQKLQQLLSGIAPQQLMEVCMTEESEYRRLFDSENSMFPSLCESVYRGLKGEDLANCMMDIHEMYAHHGIVFNKLNHERDDHIVLELEFMAVLVERTLDSKRIHSSHLELIDSQIQFLDQHLLQWVPLLAEDLSFITRSPLYMEVANVLKEFITDDMKMLCAWRASMI
ncbi:TorA maturation chaperone TorD [Paenibacillus sp. DS2015]|uniref:TorD/DmsD family molecular chaperone n=1 Tax=Paenibacillus sp. DS2015 TaxID=3373917 RepID=UPI003D208756